MEKKIYKLDDFHYFEVLDRSAIIMENFNEHVLEHPAVQNNKELKELCERVSDKIYKVYNISSSYLSGEASENRAKFYEG